MACNNPKCLCTNCVNKDCTCDGLKEECICKPEDNACCCSK